MERGKAVPFDHAPLPRRRRLWLDLDQRLTELHLEAYRGRKGILERSAGTDLGPMTLWRTFQVWPRARMPSRARLPSSVLGLDETYRGLRGEEHGLLAARDREGAVL